MYTDYTEVRPDLVDVTGDEPLLECVVNLSEGCNPYVLAALSAAAGRCLLDRHGDCAHHRSVFTLAGDESVVMDAVQDLARAAVKLLDLRGHIGAFADIMTSRTGTRHLENWLAAAENSGLDQLASFAAGIRRDHAAVRNGLTLPWSSGKVEGTVNKIKMIKRQTYGRAGFRLLRKRVLLT